MRCVAGVGLLLLVGCNQIFGIAQTQPWDAPVPEHYVTLTRLVAATGQGGAPAPLEMPAFSAALAPQIRIAPLDGSFTAVAYAAAPGDGRIAIPASYAEAAGGARPTWRLEYTLPGKDEVPHEVQWAPDDKIGHIIVPLVGRLEERGAPMGSGYTVTTSPPATYTAPRIWTLGRWTDGEANVIAPAGTVDFDFANAKALAGAWDTGTMDPALDRAFLVDLAVDQINIPMDISCTIVVGAAALGMVDLAATRTRQTVSWDTQRKAVLSDPLGFEFIDRLRTALGKLRGTFNAAGSKILFGVAPSRDFPGLSGSSIALQLPVPVMHTLMQCTYNAYPLDSTVQPKALGDFPIVLHAQILDTRRIGTINLHSGLETVLAPSPNGGFAMSFPAAIPVEMTLTTPAGAFDLAGDVDHVAAGAPSGPFVLGFASEQADGVRADYHDVVLHRLVGDTLTTVRIYTVTQPSVRIDPSVLVGGAEYVFEIRSIKGHPMAAHGDFAPVEYPYASAVVFTRTFTT